MVTKREEHAEQDTWDLSVVYASLDDWKRDLSLTLEREESPYWPSLGSFQGRLSEGPTVIREAIDRYLTILRQIEKLYTYAHHFYDEDLNNNTAKDALDRVVNYYHAFSQESAWFRPEFMSIPEETLKKYLDTNALKPYRFFIEKIARNRPHTLSLECESLLALGGKSLDACHRAFSSFDDADLRFPGVTDGFGEERELTHAKYGQYMQSFDRTLRENAFKACMNAYGSYSNTLADLLSGHIDAQVFHSRARKHESSLDAALFGNNIDTSVYRQLISTVNSNIGALHEYMTLRKEMLGLGELHLYDVYVPLVKESDFQMSYNEAAEAIVSSVAPLGGEYQDKLRKGLNEERWVDRYENVGKRSGAYSGGCYGTPPYILMNYTGILREVFTLAHEAGHSMHSLYSREKQPYHYSDYSIFVAEVASTYNEDLLMRHLMERVEDPATRLYLINQKVEDIRATLFRQTMFAEFELWLYEMVEKGEPLTVAALKEKFFALNETYYGKSTYVDQEIAMEWARIPHFYYNFYVYQYATGISAALALTDQLFTEGETARQRYLQFLSGGCSQYPVELLAQAGVDMRSSAPVAAAIKSFRGMVKEMRQLAKQVL